MSVSDGAVNRAAQRAFKCMVCVARRSSGNVHDTLIKPRAGTNSPELRYRRKDLVAAALTFVCDTVPEAHTNRRTLHILDASSVVGPVPDLRRHRDAQRSHQIRDSCRCRRARPARTPRNVASCPRRSLRGRLGRCFPQLSGELRPARETGNNAGSTPCARSPCERSQYARSVCGRLQMSPRGTVMHITAKPKSDQFPQNRLLRGVRGRDALLERTLERYSRLANDLLHVAEANDAPAAAKQRLMLLVDKHQDPVGRILQYRTSHCTRRKIL